MNWKSWLIILGMILVVGVFVAWQLSPRVISHQPSETELHSRQPLIIDFSQRMDPESANTKINFTPEISGSITWNDSYDQLTFIPDDIWPAGQIFSLEIDRGVLSHIKLPSLNPYRATLLISPYLLTYLWPAEGSSNLYVANPETGESQALTGESTGILDYATNQDGSLILYSQSNKDGTSSIMALDRESSSLSTLIDCPDGLCRSPQISSDSKLLAYEYISRKPDSQPGIRIYDLNTQDSVDLGNPNEYLEKPLWGSSGWLAYYNQTQKGYVFWQPVTEQTMFLPNDTGGDGSWSSDGRYFIATEIQFTSQTLAPRHLLLFDTIDENNLDLTQGNFLEDLNPSFSPNGLNLAYSRKSLDPQNWTPGRQLWVLDIETGENRQLTDTGEYHHSSFSWHPDGDKLAFVRFNQATLSEPPEIWMINKDGTESIRLIINGYAPGWIP
jgi:Tol biopolymer transport system component